MGVRVRNARKTRVDLDLRVKRIRAAAYAEMKAGAELLHERSKEMVPVDTGNLKDAIVLSAEGKHRFIIEVDDTHPVERAKAGRMNVGSYAMLVHENIRPEGMVGEYGENSPHPDAGPFFFDRAIAELEPEIIDAVRKATKKASQ